MGRFLTLLMMMILVAMAQNPSPYTTQGLLNGASWVADVALTKRSYVEGVIDGSIVGAYTVSERLPKGDCYRSGQSAIPTWFQSTSTSNGTDVVREMDGFYKDGSNISMPRVYAFVWAQMKLGGATQAELDQYRDVMLRSSQRKTN